jgi:CHAT domain-containing protein/tetratricopeptide (TPR) repeat protein
MMRAIAAATILILLVVSPLPAQQTSAQAPDEYDRALDLANEYAAKGLVDKAMVVLGDAVRQAESSGNKRRAAEVHLLASRLYRELGMSQAFINSLTQAMMLAVGTDLEVPTTDYLELAAAQIDVERGNIGAPLDTIGRVFEALPQVQSATMRDNLESIALTLRVRIQKQVAHADLDRPASGWSADERRVLEVLLTDDLTLTRARMTGSAAALERRKPLKKALLETALTINDRVTALDRRNGDEFARDLEVAKDLSLRATILGDLGRFDEAIELKKSTLKVFDDHNVFADAVIDLDNLCDLSIGKGDPFGALKYSIDLVHRIEGQTFAQVGQTAAAFLEQYASTYARHAKLLWWQYRVLRDQHEPNAAGALNSFLIQADRTNFRAPRRDMAIYHDLGAAVGSDAAMVARLQPALDAVIATQRAVDEAVAAAKRPSDYQRAPGLVINSPFTAAADARQQFIRALEDIKRKETRSIDTDPAIASYMADVTSGMTVDDGILMYFDAPDEERTPFAAVITATSGRVLALAPDTRSRVAALSEKLQRQIAVDAQPILDELSALLLGPIDALPKRLTIVLDPGLVGVPFEALAARAGGPRLVEGHDIRYAFGLYRGVGAHLAPATVRRAMVVGAETFLDTVAESLPQSRQEVDGIRAWLSGRHVEVLPAAALPSTGRPMLSAVARYDIIHISTHSRLDADAPLLDALLFPRDKIYAYELALAPLRSALVVLSACELYRPRADRLYPVSGVTTAALGRIAPQVISPAWDVNAAATRVFMLRFYSALLDDGDAATALARTKRDFASGDGLRRWLAVAGLDSNSVDVDEYRNPYYWAPFVLTLGIMPDASR